MNRVPIARHRLSAWLLAAIMSGSAFAAPPTAREAAQAKQARHLYLGADLSYVNEMEDCGAVYRKNGKQVDPFKLFAAEGANLVRVRIWNNATWTRYSNLADVRKTIARAKAAGMRALLDFHYSDDWADGEKQIMPAAWRGLSTEQQAKALHDYTLDILTKLGRDGLMPEMVQVGNETNSELAGSKKGDPIDWKRNALLFKAGIRAVREAGAKSSIKPRVMIHIAQPENVEPWFEAAEKAGIREYDLIGISYYRKWSSMELNGLADVIARVKQRFGKDVIVVETAYPFTTDGADSSPNLLGDALNKGYPATPQGQRNYLIDLTKLVVRSGGRGVVYWEPAWVSTKCRTRWGQGSNWENATFFDFHMRNEALPAFDWLHQKYGPGTK